MQRVVLGVLIGLLWTPLVFAADGVLILAHGGSARWNRTVQELVQQAHLEEPTEIVFGMGMHAAEVHKLQQAVERLERRGVDRLIAVPLLISSASEVMRQYEYLLGLQAHGPWEAHAHHVTVHVPVVMTQPLNDDPIVGEILLERALALSTHPEQESVVIVAHGPNDDADNERWLAAMKRLAGQIQQQGRFRMVIPVTMRDDARRPIRDAATRRLREIVAQQSQQGRTLVVPLLLAGGGVEAKIPKRLSGLRFIYRGQALLPHPKLAQWLAQRVHAADEPVVQTSRL